MEVMLTKDVNGVGTCGERKIVKDGYAINYLFPNKYAIKVTKGNVKAVADIEKMRAIRLKKEREESEELAKRIAKLSLTINRKSGEDEKLFGSVTNDDIAEALKDNGIEVDKKKVLLKEPIKKIGVYHVDIKLQSEVMAKAKVWVVKE